MQRYCADRIVEKRVKEVALVSVSEASSESDGSIDSFVDDRGRKSEESSNGAL